MFQRLPLLWLALLLVGSAARGQDAPKKKTDEPTSKAEYEKLEKEHVGRQKELLTKARSAKKNSEQETLFDDEERLGVEYAGKFLSLAEREPAVATKAVFWCLYTNNVRKPPAKAVTLAVEMIDRLPPGELHRILPFHGMATTELLDAVMKRANSLGDDPVAVDLLGWVAGSRMFFRPGQVPKCVTAATDRLLAAHPNHRAVARLVDYLYGRSEECGEVLKKIAGRTSDPTIRASSTFALGKNLLAQYDALGDKPDQWEKAAADAEKTLARAIELLKSEKLAEQVAEAERELKAFRAIRLGKSAPEIGGKDLDGKAFKLSEYRGKVVLLDFWGNW